MYKLGAIPSPIDVRNYKLSKFIDVYPERRLPEGYLVPPFEIYEEIPVYDQYSSETCVAQAISWAMAQKQAVEYGKPFDRLSVGWIYGNRVAGDHGGEGMVTSQALRQLIKDGTPPFDMFPEVGKYATAKDLVKQRRGALLPKAVPNRALSYVQLDTPYEAKLALMETGAVMICVRVHRSFYNVPDTGIVPDPEGSVDGGHAMTLIGWTKIRGHEYYIVLNSWGTKWGKKGICFMPTNYKAITEMWAITDYEIKTTTAAVPAQILNPGAFAVPVRAMMESIGAEVSFNNTTKTATAIIPPNLKTRKMTITQGSPDIIVEVVE